jgi:hypothetical protein
MTVHKLVGDTLVRERNAIIARCACGWSSGGHFTIMGASAAMMDHQEAYAKSNPLTAYHRPEGQ